MWTAVAWVEFGLSGLPPATHITRCSAPVAAKHALLEIMSPNSGDLSLQIGTSLGQYFRQSCFLQQP
jgi:hypothetical protein